MVNTVLLEATMTEIRDHPELHRQGTWFSPAECGTAMCFAGRACSLSGMEQRMPGTLSPTVMSPWGDLPARRVAQRLLGLTDCEQVVLFDSSNTRLMLELMVKDLSNGGLLGDRDYYHTLVS